MQYSYWFRQTHSVHYSRLIDFRIIDWLRFECGESISNYQYLYLSIHLYLSIYLGPVSCREEEGGELPPCWGTSQGPGEGCSEKGEISQVQI